MTLSLSSSLLASGAGIVGLLGAIHLFYTGLSAAFEPRDRELGVRMRNAAIVLTDETTLWKAWIGFNASHGLGAVVFGLVYGNLALFHHGTLVGSAFLSLTGIAAIAAYVALAARYWFRVPLVGTVAAGVLFLAGLAAA